MNSEGWQIGVGPSIVVINKQMARSLTSTTVQNGVKVLYPHQPLKTLIEE